MRQQRTTAARFIGCVLFALLFVAAGFYHFREAQGFAEMLPDFVPLRLEIIYATGIAEWIFALLLLVPAVRRQTGNWIVWYLVLIFPANIYAAIYGIPAPGSTDTSQAALWIRLLFQPLLIWWVWWATRLPNTRNS
ncbi:hypothetical protein BBD42_05275 [Paenibacillus sp. BIHB 4019]|uniref:DoxX family protein n=1 Tax=Paenibacillus sp. BIHB 4019 TaxID=1870819 RepID=A0A1B2DDZ5_9BACL|nr:hypothetical protein [Paenibacillus sp. BIHB 4019]ANY65941.1 hypothetical protein BBD42_05275 [Paenibacillus sp. BIHB 4019]